MDGNSVTRPCRRFTQSLLLHHGHPFSQHLQTRISEHFRWGNKAEGLWIGTELRLTFLTLRCNRKRQIYSRASPSRRIAGFKFESLNGTPFCVFRIHDLPLHRRRNSLLDEQETITVKVRHSVYHSIPEGIGICSIVIG